MVPVRADDRGGDLRRAVAARAHAQGPAVRQRCRGLSRSARGDRARPRGRPDRRGGGRGGAGSRCRAGSSGRRTPRRRAPGPLPAATALGGAARSPSLRSWPCRSAPAGSISRSARRSCPASRWRRARRTGPRINRSTALVAQVEAHLARNPEDGRGWEVIAPVYLRLGRFDDAVKARRNALRLRRDRRAASRSGRGAGRRRRTAS